MSSKTSVPYNFNPGIGHPLYLMRKSILKHINAYKHQLNGKMLDFGCGSKPYRSLFHVEEYIGLDYENEGHPHLNEDIDVFYDGEHIPFPANSFDAVLATEVFEHVFNLDKTLTEINRVMKQGGKLLISCPFVWPEHETPYDFARYSSFGMKALLERNGFEVLSLDKTTGFAEALCQIWLVYMNTTFFGYLKIIPGAGQVLRTALISVTNLFSLVLGKLLPLKSEWYLGLVVLAQKK